MSLTRIILLMNQADYQCVPMPGSSDGVYRGLFKVVGELNEWLAYRKFDGHFDYCDHGIFAMDSSNIDVRLLATHLHLLPWAYPQDVQVLTKGPTDSHYEMGQLQLDYFRDCQEFLASAEAKKPEVWRMIEDAILLKRQEDRAAEPLRKIRCDVAET